MEDPRHQLGTGDPAVRFLPSGPLNHTIFASDIAGSADRRRTDDDHRLMREHLYRILQGAFAAAGIPWSACIHQDHGDGVRTAAPPNIPSVCLVDPLLAHLAGRLRKHNLWAEPATQIRLRVAINIGPVARDANGLTGQALIQVRQTSGPINPEAYRRIRARVKESRITGWVYLAGPVPAIVHSGRSAQTRSSRRSRTGRSGRPST